jgi:hypothetical protein
VWKYHREDWDGGDVTWNDKEKGTYAALEEFLGYVDWAKATQANQPWWTSASRMISLMTCIGTNWAQREFIPYNIRNINQKSQCCHYFRNSAKTRHRIMKSSRSDSRCRESRTTPRIPMGWSFSQITTRPSAATNGVWNVMGATTVSQSLHHDVIGLAGFSICLTIRLTSINSLLQSVMARYRKDRLSWFL